LVMSSIFLYLFQLVHFICFVAIYKSPHLSFADFRTNIEHLFYKTPIYRCIVWYFWKIFGKCIDISRCMVIKLVY